MAILPGMTLRLLMGVVLTGLALFFVATSLLTRAPRRRIVAALVGGVGGGVVGAALDAVGHWLRLWDYVVGNPAHAPWPIYLGVAFAQAALALIAWRIGMRFSVYVQLAFIGVVAAAATAQDYIAAAVGPKVQVIAPGIAPAIGDFLVWSAVTSTALAIMYTLAGTVAE